MPAASSIKLSFTSDYLEGAHPRILERLMETNLVKSAGYGLDSFSEAARDKIRTACKTPEADVFFLSGGTQTNATVIDAVLKSYQGVLSADTGHISTHEAGAIELGGHKVLTIPHTNGKITAESIRQAMETFEKDGNHDHTVMPAMVYISQPTEFGTLYSLGELNAISSVCREYGLFLYLDGARLAYALACPQNDAELPDIAAACDAFYIGGTKCGTLFGEAVVLPKHNTIPHFFTIIKQHGALLAKGRIAGLQFDTLFTDGLYSQIGQNAIHAAERIRSALLGNGYTLAIDSPTNQIFVLMTNAQEKTLSEKIDMGFWDRPDQDHIIMRIATSWATTDADVDALISVLKECR